MRFHSILKIKPSPIKKKSKKKNQKHFRIRKTVTDLGVGNMGSNAGQHFTMAYNVLTPIQQFQKLSGSNHDAGEKKKEETHFLFNLNHRMFG